MPSILIDTGAIRALLDPGDKYHGQAVALFKSLGPADDLLTTWPVITECSFAIERNRVAMWQWVHDSGIEIVDFSIQDLPAMQRLVAPYSDRLVDFADATLLWLAMRRHTRRIATTDFNDFETYRLPGRLKFDILFTRR